MKDNKIIFEVIAKEKGFKSNKCLKHTKNADVLVEFPTDWTKAIGRIKKAYRLGCRIKILQKPVGGVYKYGSGT
jgi:hypothetical protein